MLKTITKINAFALISFALAPAVAQTVPTWLYYGSVPTVAQWQSGFAGKNDVLGYTPLNKAGDAMLGELYTIPSSGASSGFNIPQGVAPSSPVNGDIWTTSAGLFVRAGGTTYNVSGGSITCGQMPAMTGDVTSPAGSCVNTLATVPIAKGGTGQTSASAALTALGGAPIASPIFTGVEQAPAHKASGAISQAAWTTSGVVWSDVGSAVQDMSSSGTVSQMFVNFFAGHAISALSATTYTTAVTMDIAPPTASTNVAFGTAYALRLSGSEQILNSAGLGIFSQSTSGFGILSVSTSNTQPVFLPRNSDTLTGIGSNAGGQMDFFGNGNDVARVNSTDFTDFYDFKLQGHQAFTGAAPTVGTCGTSPGTPVGSDTDGQVVAGTGTVASCTINFNSTYASTPRCFAYDNTAYQVLRTSSGGTSSFNILAATTLGGDTIRWHCVGS